MIITKLGLEGEDEEFLARTCFVSPGRFRDIVSNLKTCGLMLGDGSLQGFEDSQVTPEAARKRRQRDRDESRKSGVTSHGTSHGDRREKREEVDEEEESPPVSPPRGERIPFAKIVESFNEIAKPARPYRTKPVNKAVERLIRARWNEGMREADFAEVVRLQVERWGSNPDMVAYIRPHTLWTGKMEGYLAAGAARRQDGWKDELRDELGGS